VYFIGFRQRPGERLSRVGSIQFQGGARSCALLINKLTIKTFALKAFLKSDGLETKGNYLIETL